MAYWNITAPDYIPPTQAQPAWVWSIAGWGNNNQNGVDSVVLRLDYVKLDANGNYVRVNNFRPGYGSGDCTKYIPIFINLNEGTTGNGGGSLTAGYDYFADANTLWKNFIYKFLYGMKTSEDLVLYIPLPDPVT